jgi:predicted nucleic acid-binding Zn ribbon protein
VEALAAPDLGVKCQENNIFMEKLGKQKRNAIIFFVLTYAIVIFISIYLPEKYVDVIKNSPRWINGAFQLFIFFVLGIPFLNFVKVFKKKNGK